MLNGLEQIHGRPFDLAVIGGGMAGAGIARDAALRGYRTLLLERTDFAYGTTSRSSKLVHGGLRYLELYDFGLVRESLRERERLQRLATHLVRPLPFVIPVYRGAKRGMIMIRMGMKLYDLLTPGKRTEHYRTISRNEALQLEQHLEPRDLLGAGYYFDDLLLSPERLCLENVLSAQRWGAVVFNAAEVTAITPASAAGAGPAWTIEVRGTLTGALARVTARVVVNATGPWADQVRRLAGVDGGRRCLRTTKGVHLLLPRITDHAVYVAAQQDDRMFFVIPWRDLSLVGTTDTDFDGDLDRLAATREEVAYLLQEAQRALPGAGVQEQDIAYTYAGVRPLTFQEGKSASAVSRQHTVVPEGEGGSFLTITGTKLTCYRSLAEEAVDRVGRLLGHPVSCRTHRLALDGSDGEETIEVRLWADVLGPGPPQRVGAHADPGPDRHLRTLVPERAGPGGEIAGAEGAPLPAQPGDPRPAPLRLGARAGRDTAGFLAAPHRDRDKPLPGPGLLRGDRPLDGGDPGVEPGAHPAGDRGVPGGDCPGAAIPDQLRGGRNRHAEVMRRSSTCDIRMGMTSGPTHGVFEGGVRGLVL